MPLDRHAADATLALARGLALVTPDEADAVRRALDEGALAPLGELAESAHLHVRVTSTAAVPASALRDAGARVEREREGYVKYAFPSGLHLIFSSLEHDHGARPTPGLDHVGLDVRRDDAEARARADEAVARASAEGWRHVAQGGDGASVSCCHATVARKHWLFRDGGAPVEIALGPLHEHAEAGRDGRPRDPAESAPASACCAPAPEALRPAGGLLRKKC